METPPEGYRRNVGICLLSPSEKVFTAESINLPGTWQMPQGGANEGEDLKSAAMRELREETGVTLTEFLAKIDRSPMSRLKYDFALIAKGRSIAPLCCIRGESHIRNTWYLKLPILVQ